MSQRLSTILFVGLFAGSMFVSGLRGGDASCSSGCGLMAVSAMAGDEGPAMPQKACCSLDSVLRTASVEHQPMAADHSSQNPEGEQPLNNPCSGGCDCTHCGCTVSVPLIDTSSQPPHFTLPGNSRQSSDRFVPTDQQFKLLRPPQS